MKKQILTIVVGLGLMNASMVNAAESLKRLFGADNKKQTSSHTGSHVDTVAFWNTVVKLLDKNGYSADSDFGRHARSNLHRVQTLRSGGYAKHPRHKTSSSREIVTPKKVDMGKSKEAEKRAEKAAFEKGKKSGQAHEYYLRRKAAAAKKSPKKAKKLETKKTKRS